MYDKNKKIKEASEKLDFVLKIKKEEEEEARIKESFVHICCCSFN
jgi:hypothetical protein